MKLLEEAGIYVLIVSTSNYPFNTGIGGHISL